MCNPHHFLLFVVHVAFSLSGVDYTGVINSHSTGNNPPGCHPGPGPREEQHTRASPSPRSLFLINDSVDAVFRDASFFT